MGLLFDESILGQVIDRLGMMQNRGGSGYARATRGRVGTCIRVSQGLSVGRLSGWVKVLAVGRKLSTRPNFRAAAYRWVYLAE